MNTRMTLAIAFGVGSAVFMGLGVLLDGDRAAGLVGVLGNIGAEILGIALTVAIIDWLMERRRLNEQVHQMAWRFLHDIDHSFWVWQGGRQEFHLDELVALLGVAELDDPFPTFTEELFINLGIRASDTLRLQPKLMKHDRRLKAAMQSLKGLAQVREAKRQKILTDNNNYIIEGLKNAVSNLAELTDQTPHSGEFAQARSFRDPSIKAQEHRYRGSLHETIMRADAARVAVDLDQDQDRG